jgi:hypothetical protein
LKDTLDVMAVQTPGKLDMDSIKNRCATHGTTERLEAILKNLPQI